MSAIQEEPDSRPKITFAESDVIDTYDELARRFLSDVLDISFESVLLTDESSLADFCPSGIKGQDFQAMKDWKAICAAWDPLIVSKVRSIYGIEEFSVTEPLVVTLRRIEQHEQFASGGAKH